jgi:hypothetical protein
MKTILLFVFVVAYFCSAFAQIDETVKGKPLVKVKYYQDFLNFRSAKPGITRLDIFIEVPYNEIQFVKVNDKFESKYTATVSVFAEDKEKLIEEKTWDEKVVVSEFPHTSSETSFNISIRSFELPAGKYFIKTSIEDQDSKKTFNASNMFTVRDLIPLPNISDLMFIAKQTVVSGSKKILPNVTRNIAVQKDGIPLFFELYSDSRRKIVMEFDVLEGEKKLMYSDSLSRFIDSGKTQMFRTINLKGLGLGTYFVGVTLDRKSVV